MAFAALVLMAAVAAAARAPASSATSRAAGGLGVDRPLGDLVVGAVAAILVVLVYLAIEDISWRRSKDLPWDRGAQKRPWWHWAAHVASLAVFIGLVALWFAVLGPRKAHSKAVPQGTGASAHVHLFMPGVVNGGGWPAFLTGSGLAIAAIIGLELRGRSGRRVGLRPVGGPPALDLADERALAGQAVDASLGALLAEPDPRRAVVLAYARMEQWLAHSGYGRHPWEAPFEHLDRVVAGLGATAAVGATLAGLYERAKFDNRPCGPEMKREAIAALTELREDLAKTWGNAVTPVGTKGGL